MVPRQARPDISTDLHQPGCEMCPAHPLLYLYRVYASLIGSWVGVNFANLKTALRRVFSTLEQPSFISDRRGEVKRQTPMQPQAPRLRYQSSTSLRSNRLSSHPPSSCPASANRSHRRLIFRLPPPHLRQSWYKISRLKGISGRSLPRRPPSLSPSAPQSMSPMTLPAMGLLFKKGTRGGKRRTLRSGWPSKSPRNHPICSFH